VSNRRPSPGHPRHAPPPRRHDPLGTDRTRGSHPAGTPECHALGHPEQTGWEGEVVPWNATDEQLTAGLEVLYGPHSVEVTGGPHEGALKPYVVKFVGEKADRRLTPVDVSEIWGGLQGKASSRELIAGRSDGQIVLFATDLGDASANGESSPITVSDELPEGLKAVGISAEAGKGTFGKQIGRVKCVLARLSCEFAGILPSYYSIEVILPVVVEADAKSGEVNQASVAGGGAAGVSIKRPVTMSSAPTPFGVESYELSAEEEGGAPDTQAGSHPFQLTTTIGLNEELNGRLAAKPVVMAKDLNFKIPPGLIGNPTPFPRCTIAQFHSEGENRCAETTVVGVAKVYVKLFLLGQEEILPVSTPLYNLEPSTGEPARFGFIAEGATVTLDTSVRTGDDYGVTVSVDNITQTAEFLSSEVTFWGVPGDPRHNSTRGPCLTAAYYGGECPAFSESKPPPLISLPTSCTGVLHSTVEADSWEKEGEFASLANTEEIPGLDGCNRLQFEPSITVTPDGQAGSTPTGLAVTVHVPQQVSLDGEGLSEADVKSTTVALPEGVALNPAAGDGLQACSVSQIGLNEAGPSSCPESSKIALVKIKTPLLPNALEGDAYLAAQNENPFGSLLAVYVVAEDPVSGTRVKLAGEVVANQATGQLVSTFKNTPQLPFETFEIHFFGGDRAPLATPAHCGSYTTMAAIEPWTEAGEVDSSSTFDIRTGPASFDEPVGRACPGARLPFSPSLTGGATNVDAGAFSPLTLTFSRKDGEQNIQSAEAHLPPGLSGILSNIELCPEPQADEGACGPNSLIGETTVSVGIGGDPFTVAGGKFYLTGPYNGTGSCTIGSPGCAPFGITFAVPAKAGPFDLKRDTSKPASEDACDCVVVRGKLEVDPITAAVTVKSDPPGSPYAIPTSIDGIPLEIQHVNATTTRGNFQFNPTNCEKMRVTGSIDSSESTLFNVSVPFQVTNCAILAFKPAFKVSTSAKTSRADGASLKVKLTYPKAPFGSQANIKSVKVDLPKQLPSRLTTLQKACTAAQFQANPAGCPAASIVGHATAITPLVPVPLTGPAYFVSYGGAKFPELVIVLQGYNVTLDLHGETFINKAGITSSTFHTIPDAPVGSFELTLPQGKYSALAANGNLCKTKLNMPTMFAAQNGMTIKQTTPISVTGCTKTKAKKKHKKAAAKRKGK